jgi:hypothetical protein
MGIEYTLRVTEPDEERIVALIRLLPEVREMPGQGFEVGPFGGGWPTASVSPDTDGVYFIDYGGGHELLDQLVALLTEAFGPVTVEEL